MSSHYILSGEVTVPPVSSGSGSAYQYSLTQFGHTDSSPFADLKLNFTGRKSKLNDHK